MGIEIERKFLLHEAAGTAWKDGISGVYYRQGYLSREKGCTVRVRVAGGKGWLTIKGATSGAMRQEYEYVIPHEEAMDLLRNMAQQPLIEKYRYSIPFAGHVWEVDEFLGENRGLVVAEVELQCEGEAVELPPWAGREVTGDTRYYNSNLAEMPFSCWNNNNKN